MGDVHTPRPLQINGLRQFFPKLVYQEGEPDSPPLGPFRVRGSYSVERKERDVPLQRFLILKPEGESTLPAYNEYAVEYPPNLLTGNLITFYTVKSASRIRIQIEQRETGFSVSLLRLRSHNLPVRDYVIYEEQVEGTWIPIEADGTPLKP